jgi:rhodanese-related sulfurtransferase
MRAINFLRIILVAIALAACSSWVLSVQRENSNSTGQQSLTVPDGIALLTRPEAEASWLDPETLFLDVRSLEDYNVGHIQGSLSFPYEEIPERLPAVQAKWERANRLIVYCKSTDCGKSLWAAIRLRNAGLHQVAIYPGGWNEWVLAGLPVAGEGR